MKSHSTATNPSLEVGDPEGIRTPGRNRASTWEDEDPFSGLVDEPKGFDHRFESPTSGLTGTPAARQLDAEEPSAAPTLRSRIFTTYNAAKPMVADRKRLDRALGLVLRKGDNVRYITTADRCTCPDWVYRGSLTKSPCKHMLARAIKAVAS